MNHRPVCVKCQKEMRPETNGVGCLDMTAVGPYQVWDADLWKCPKCGVEILAGFPSKPVAEHFHGDYFQKVMDGYAARGRLVQSRQ